MNQYPVELRQPPVPVMSLVYLPEQQRKLTTTVSLMMDGVMGGLKVLCFKDETQMSSKKLKKPYEGYKPQGILKRDWMRKHQEQIPAVVVILQRWMVYQTDASYGWKQQELAFIAAIEKIKSTCSGRPTRFMVLLIADRMPQDQEHQTVDELLTNIRKLANLDSKAVHVVVEDDIEDPNVLGSKTSKYIQDACASYYRDVINRIRKTLKSDIKKDLQPYIYARLKFKLGYFSEIIRNRPKALKYFSQAYGALNGISTTDYSPGEIKSVADYINFKLCMLKLSDGKVESAVSQFLSHISWYKTCISVEDRVDDFPHHAAVGKQLRIFGEMLEIAKVKPADNRYHNPGYYFQAAASAAKRRRRSTMRVQQRRGEIEELYKDDRSTLTVEDELIVREGYVGQPIDQAMVDRALRAKEKRTATTPDAASDGVAQKSTESSSPSSSVHATAEQRLLAKEFLTVNHSEIVIAMLTKAYNHFKEQPSLNRLIYYIASSIAEEYFSTQQYEKAKQLLDRILRNYRKERWFALMAPAIRNSLACSKQLKQPMQFVSNSLEFISTKVNLPVQEQEQVLSELIDYLKGSNSFEMPALEAPIVKEMEPSDVLLRLRVQFDTPSAVAYDQFYFVLDFTNFAPMPLTFQRLRVIFSDSAYNISVQHQEEFNSVNLGNDAADTEVSSDSRTVNLTLRPMGERTTLSFPLAVKDVQDLQCLAVILHLNDGSSSVYLQWKMTNNKYFVRLLNDYDHRLDVGQGDFVERPVIKITQPEPKLAVAFEHPSPALVNELYAIRIILDAGDEHVLSGKIHLRARDDVSLFNSKLEPTTTLEFGEIKPHTTSTVLLITQCSSCGARAVSLKFQYATTLYHEMILERQVNLDYQYPFECRFKFTPTRPDSNLQMFHLIPNQSLNYSQRLVNNVCVNVSMNNPSLVTETSTGQPFKFSEGFAIGEPIVLVSKMTCHTPYSVTLCKVELDVDEENFVCVSSATISIEHNIPQMMTTHAHNKDGQEVQYKNLRNKDSFSTCHIVRAIETGHNLPLGRLVLTCRRSNPLDLSDVLEDEESRRNLEMVLNETTFDFPMPNISTFANSLSVMYDIVGRDDATIGQPLQMDVYIENNTPMVQPLQLTVKDSDSFFLSGITTTETTILPYETSKFSYGLIPVLIGNVALPKFEISAVRDMTSVVFDQEVWTIYIRPAEFNAKVDDNVPQPNHQKESEIASIVVDTEKTSPDVDMGAVLIVETEEEQEEEEERGNGDSIQIPVPEEDGQYVNRFDDAESDSSSFQVQDDNHSPTATPLTPEAGVELSFYSDSSDDDGDDCDDDDAAVVVDKIES